MKSNFDCAKVVQYLQSRHYIHPCCRPFEQTTATWCAGVNAGLVLRHLAAAWRWVMWRRRMHIILVLTRYKWNFNGIQWDIYIYTWLNYDNLITHWHENAWNKAISRKLPLLNIVILRFSDVTLRSLYFIRMLFLQQEPWSKRTSLATMLYMSIVSGRPKQVQEPRSKREQKHEQEPENNNNNNHNPPQQQPRVWNISEWLFSRFGTASAWFSSSAAYIRIIKSSNGMVPEARWTAPWS